MSARLAQVGYYHGVTFFRPRRTEDVYDEKSGKVVLKKETCQEYEKLRSEHDKNEQQQRKQAQDDFLTGKTNVMVANDALGQGVDLPDIRLVIHWGVPKGMETYYNQIGRGGRDGAPTTCEFIYQPSDFHNHEANIRNDWKKKVIDRFAFERQVCFRRASNAAAVHLYFSTAHLYYSTADGRLICMRSCTR